MKYFPTQIKEILHSNRRGAFKLPDRAEVAVHVGGQVAGVLLHQLPQNHLSLHLMKPQLCRSLLNVDGI